MDNPLYAAANAARLARYARPQQSGYAPEVASQEGADTPQPMNKPPEMAAPAPQAAQEAPSSLLQSAGGVAASGLSAVANAIDLPGSVGRDLLTWLPGGLAPHNPLDQLIDPFGANAHKNRIEGREVNRSYGLAGPRDTWGNFATGLVLEMASDPLTYTGLGVLGKGAKALSTAGLLSDKSGLIKEMAEAAGKSSKKIGGRGSSKRVTVGQVFDHWKATRDRLIKESTDGKVAGSRLKSKNTYSNLDELKDMSPDVLKDNNWAVVDNGGKYDIYQWKAGEKTGGEWARLAEPSESLKARLRQTSTNQTLDSIRSAYNSQLQTLYPGVNPESLLNKPLESIVSFRAPFTQKSLDVNIPDAAQSWNRHLEKQPIEVKSNKAGSTAGDATTLDSAAPGGKPKAASAASDAADAGYNPHDVEPVHPDEIKANAKDWGLLLPDGSIRKSNVGPEADRVLYQAAKTFGKEAVDTWDVIETAGVGAAKLKGVTPEEFFRDISISGGTKDDLKRLKEGGALEQGGSVKTATPEFKQWFGDWEGDKAAASKVVDDSGKPLVVYHGTPYGFDEFRTSSDRDLGSHFGNQAQANDVAGFKSVDNEGGRLVPVYLSIKNPARMADPESWKLDSVAWESRKHPELFDKQTLLAIEESEKIVEAHKQALIKDSVGKDISTSQLNKQIDALGTKTLKEQLELLGFDGVAYGNKYEGAKDGAQSYIAFHPNQIKSATANSGKYNPLDPNILAQSTVSAEARGAIFIDGARQAIKAFKDGNISTLHHEFAHAMRQMLDGDTLSSAIDAVAAKIKSINTSAVKKAEKTGKKYTPVEMFKEDGVTWSREAEEVWAESWERYLKDGKSPVKALETAFAKLKEWLVGLYKDIKNHPVLSRQLNDKTRTLFDKIIETGDAELRPGVKVASETSAAATGVPTMMTRAMESALKGAGYTQDQIDNLTPQQAWDELSSNGLVGKDGSIAPNVPPAATGAVAAASGAVADAIPPSSAETPLTGTVGAVEDTLPSTPVAQDVNTPPAPTPVADVRDPIEAKAVDDAKAEIDADARSSVVKDVVSRAPQGVRAEILAYGESKVPAMREPAVAPRPKAKKAPQRGAAEGPVKAKGKARSISDSLSPRKETPKPETKSGADILTGRTRAKGKASAAKGLPPGASIETTPDPTAFSNLTRMQFGDPISIVVKSESGEELGRITYMPKGGPIDVFVKESERRKGIGTALYDALEKAGGKIPAKDSGFALSKEAELLRASRAPKPRARSGIDDIMGWRGAGSEAKDAAPKSGADILTGRTRAKGKARSIEDSLTPSTEQMPTMPQKAAPAAKSRKPGLAGMVAKRTSTETKNPLSDVVQAKKRPVNAAAREAGIKESELEAMRLGANGDKQALRELGFEDSELAAVLSDIRLGKTQLDKMEMLAALARFPDPKEAARLASATVKAVAENATDAAKRAANREKVAKLLEKNGVWKAFEDKVGTANSPDDTAVSILWEKAGHELKSRDDALKLHEKLIEASDDYAKAVDDLGKKTDASESALDKTDLAIRSKYVNDPYLETAKEGDILAPAPKRVTEKDMPKEMSAADKKQAVSDNERDVDLHQFRKLNLLKKQGKRAEATEVANELAEHYQTLPGKIAWKMLSPTKDVAQVEKLIADGGLSLLNAIEKFDYTRGFKFGSYFGGSRGPMVSMIKESWRSGKKRVRNPDEALTPLQKKNAMEQAVRDAGKAPANENFNDIVDGIVSPESSSAEKIAAAKVVEDIIRTVPAEHAEILNMKLDGLTQQEMAEALGVSVKTVQSKLKAAYDASATVKSEYAQLKNPPKAVMKDLYNQTRGAYDKVLANMKDESLRERYATMLDNGEHLFSASLPVRQFNRYFDKSVFGQNDLESQQLARKVFRSVQRAIFDSREFMAALTRAVGEHGLLDEQGAIRKLTASGMGLEEAKVAARSTMNKRNSEMVRFMENAVDKTGKKVGLHQELFGGTQVANEIEQLLTAIKYAFPERLYSQRLAGLSHRSLTDTEVDYFPRFEQGEYGRATKNSDIGDSILDASLSSQKKRNPAFKNVPGGRSVLDDMSVDGDLSGVYWKQLKLGDKPSKAMIQRSIDKMMTDEYKLRVFNPDIHFNEDGTLNKLGKQKGAQLALAMAMLPPIHAANNMPLFGRNMLHDIAKHIQDSIAREGVARAAQDVVANNVLPSVDKTQWTLSKLFEDIDLDRHQAYLNVIDGVGKRKKYNSYAKRKLADIKKKLVAGKVYKYDGGKRRLKVNGDGQFQVVDLENSVKASGDELAETTIAKPGRIIPDDQLADEINLAKKFAAKEGMSVNKNTFETATQYMSGWKQPKEISDIQRFFRASLSLFKTNVTLPFLSFHVRNFLSGNAQNWFYGAFDPSAKGTKSLARYTRPIKQAWDMRSGNTVARLYEQLPTHIRKLVDDYDATLPRDEAATDWMRQQVFKYGITGDKQGYAAEQIGDSLSSLTSQYPGAKAREQSIKNLWGILRDPQKGVPLKDKVNLLHVRGGGRPAIVQDELGKSRVGVKQYDETTSTLHRTGEDLAQTTEDMNRISPFIAFIKQGNLPEEAAAKVQRIQIDYSNLSESEKALRNWIPFWTFSSKVMYLTLGDLINNPGGKQAWAIRAANRAQKPDALAPDHIKRSVAIPWGTTESGANRYLSGLGLPFEDPLQFAGVLRGDVRGLAGEVIGRVRPELQALAEQATGRSLFFDKELEDMDPPIGRILSNVKHAVTGVEPKGLAEPFPSKGIEWAVGKSPASRYISTLMKATDQRKSLPYKLANTASGLKFTDVEPEAQERIAIDQMSNYLKQGFGGRNFERTYVPDWAKERLSQEKLRELESVQDFIQEVQKKGRERKKAQEGLKDAVSNVAGDFVAQ